MTLSGETKLFIGIFGITALIVAIALAVFSKPATPLTRDELIPSSPQATGSATAKTWLVEFSDYQCPACKTFETAVSDIRKTHPQDVYIVYRNFPLDQHPFAVPSAQTALAASRQGKFWEMHDRLFERQSDFADTLWLQLAADLGLDAEKFTADMKSRSVAEEITADRNTGFKIGINATPTFYLNGLKIDLQTPADLKKEVEKAIKK